MTMTMTQSQSHACSNPLGHHWSRPVRLVGGVESNPGIHDVGGTICVTEACRHCGDRRRTTSTYAGETTRVVIDAGYYYDREIASARGYYYPAEHAARARGRKQFGIPTRRA